MMIYILSLLLICVIIFFIYNSRKKAGNNSDLENTIDENLDFAVFNKRQIHDATRQVLESAYLMANSKIIETIIGRHELIEERIETVRIASKSELGKIHITEAVVDYEEQHGLSEIEGYQDNILLIADKNERKVFFAKTLLIGFEKHYEDQMEEISELKMDHAIEKRFSKLENKFGRVNGIVENLRHINGVDALMEKIKSDYSEMENNIRNRRITKV